MSGDFRFADSFGPSRIIHIHRPSAGLRAILVVDNTACGIAIGGVRMAPDVSLDECFHLARAMTFKNAAAGLPHGGGKSVICEDPRMPLEKKEGLIRAFAQSIRDIADYVPGPDMGTDELCMGWVKDEIGRAAGLPAAVGGIPLDELGATGYGLAACIDVARRFIDLDLNGARVVVQGFGAVGKHAARFLAEKGARLIAASDTSGTVIDERGIEVAALIAHKDAGGTVRDYQQGKKDTVDAVIDVACDIWIPAARPNVINEDNVARLKTRMVPQGANIPCTPRAEELLRQRGILVVPDFIANAGGVICASVEYHGGTASTAFQLIDEKIRANTQAVLSDSRRKEITPRAASQAYAISRIKAAAATRRWQ